MIKLINQHSEWVVFLVGLLLLATMDPYTTESSWCLIDYIGFTYCPGEGLGHSIAFFFNGEFSNSVEANLMGPLVVAGLSARVFYIWRKLFTENKSDLMENYNV